MSDQAAELLVDKLQYPRILNPGYVEMYNPVTKGVFRVKVWPGAGPLTPPPEERHDPTPDHRVITEREVTEISDDDDRHEVAPEQQEPATNKVEFSIEETRKVVEYLNKTEDTYSLSEFEMMRNEYFEEEMAVMGYALDGLDPVLPEETQNEGGPVAMLNTNGTAATDETEQTLGPRQAVEHEEGIESQPTAEATEARQELFTDEICPYKLFGLECSHHCHLCGQYHRCFVCWFPLCPDLDFMVVQKYSTCPWYHPQVRERISQDMVDAQCHTYREAFDKSRQWTDLGPRFQPHCNRQARFYMAFRTDATHGFVSGQCYEHCIKIFFYYALQEAILVVKAREAAVRPKDPYSSRLDMDTHNLKIFLLNGGAGQSPPPLPIPSTPEPMPSTGRIISPRNRPTFGNILPASQGDHPFTVSEGGISSLQSSETISDHAQQHTSHTLEEAASSGNSIPQNLHTRRTQNQNSTSLEDQQSPPVTEGTDQTMVPPQSLRRQAADDNESDLQENTGQSCPFCTRLDNAEGMLVCSNTHEGEEYAEGLWSHFSCATLTATEAETMPEYYCWDCIDQGNYPDSYCIIVGRSIRRAAQARHGTTQDLVNGDLGQVNGRSDDQTVPRNTGQPRSKSGLNLDHITARKKGSKAPAPSDDQSNQRLESPIPSSDSDSEDHGPSKGQARIKRRRKTAPKSKGKEGSEPLSSGDDEPQNWQTKKRDPRDSDSDDYAPAKGQTRIKRGLQKSAKAKGKTATENRAPPKQISGSRKRHIQGWKSEESQHVHRFMHNLMYSDPGVAKTEQRWQVISQQLKTVYNIDRSASSIKNYWNRKGRLATGLDERRKQDPSRLVTGRQDPLQRREARHKKEKEAQKSLNGGSNQDDETEDEAEEGDIYESGEEEEEEGDGGQYDENASEQDFGEAKEHEEEQGDEEGGGHNGKQGGGLMGEEDAGHGAAKKRAWVDDNGSGEEDVAAGGASPQKRRKL